MTDLLLPEDAMHSNVPTQEVHVFLPLTVVKEMDRSRREHKDYLWGSTRSYFTEMALKWFIHFLSKEANDQKTPQAGVQKMGKG